MQVDLRDPPASEVILKCGSVSVPTSRTDGGADIRDAQVKKSHIFAGQSSIGRQPTSAAPLHMGGGSLTRGATSKDPLPESAITE